VRLLCSEEEEVAPDAASVAQMLDKHPAAPADRRPIPSLDSAPLQVTAHQVMQGIQSFAPGAAGGPDGLRPQHLLDIMGVGGRRGSGPTLD